MTAPTVTAVIVNWNGAEFLGPCLQSLRQQRGVTVQPLVIDNGSTDGSLELLARDWPDVEVIPHPNNYTAANNLGVRRATTDLVLLLNTDATLDPAALGHLVQALADDPEAAAAAPRILGPDGRVQTLGIEESEHFYWCDRGTGDCDPNGGPVEPAYGLSGCCVLFRKAAWDAVGGQDEAFHMYYEDVDLSLRLRARGYTLLLVPDARCEHLGHGSISKTRSGKDILGERNRLLVIARHFPQHLPAQLVRSPWFAQADPEDHQTLLQLLAARLGDDGKDALLRTFAAGIATLVTRDVVAQGGHTLLQEREDWIATLLREVARLRIYRLPGRRLKPTERAFLDRRPQ